MNRISWSFRRFKKMPVAEYQYRIDQILRKKIDKLFVNAVNFNNRTAYAYDIKKADISEFNKYFSSSKSMLINTAEDILSHRFNIFSITKEFDKSINWHLDPRTNKSWPLKFWGDINYKDGGTIGGIKFAWELNRLHHLPHLAIAFSLTKETKYRDEIFSQLESWLEANSYPNGINWISGIELGIRIVNIIYALKLLSDERLTPAEQRLIIQLMTLHGRHLYRYPSKYSSCANHAVAEALGMFVAGLCFPNIKRASKWKDLGKKILEREVTRQIYPGGSSFEHSIHYLQFIVDIFLSYYLLCKEYNEPCSEDVETRLKSSFEFISNILDKNGNYPKIGDEDDGSLLKLWFGKHNNFISLLNSGAVLFNNPKWILDNSEFDQKTFFLLGPDSKSKWDELHKKKKPANSKHQYFKDAGLAIMREVTNPGILFVGNSGPLGLKPLSAHGHADALSFWLSVNGRPVFIDPGTYLYHSGGEWRQYFRSTSAHNTVKVDSLDQSTIVSDFICDDFYNINNPMFEETDDKVLWSAGHDGYMRLKDPVFHKRWITYMKKERQLIIKDYIECKKSHLIECFFHLHPDCFMTEKDNLFEIECGEIRIRMVVDEKWSQRKIIKGAKNPLNGWYSPCFNKLKESFTLKLNTDINGNESFRSTIYLK